jgi:hypothetical protein
MLRYANHSRLVRSVRNFQLPRLVQMLRDVSPYDSFLSHGTLLLLDSILYFGALLLDDSFVNNGPLALNDSLV